MVKNFATATQTIFEQEKKNEKRFEKFAIVQKKKKNKKICEERVEENGRRKLRKKIEEENKRKRIVTQAMTKRPVSPHVTDVDDT